MCCIKLCNEQRWLYDSSSSLRTFNWCVEQRLASVINQLELVLFYCNKYCKFLSPSQCPSPYTCTHTHTHTYTHALLICHLMSSPPPLPSPRDGQALASSCYDENMSDDEDMGMKKGGSKQTTEAKWVSWQLASIGAIDPVREGRVSLLLTQSGREGLACCWPSQGGKG